MKNAGSLEIELGKFSGYDCAMDFFTFKSDFKRVKEQTVQRKHLADYLKKNHLTGSAYALVEKEDDYEKIWAKLKESYGNPRLLLQNKLLGLDSFGGLWKIKGESKISNALARLINTMKDLSFLAKEHCIEGQLYEGGGLEKILILIGKDRHKKFRTQNLSSLDKKVEFEKLQDFLQKELLLLNQLNLDNKTAQLMGLDVKLADSNKPAFPTLYGPSSPVVLRCHFCDEDGHTIITTAKGNKIIPYYVCKKFCELSAANRFLQLQAKNLCTSCLYPGAPKGPPHRCYFLQFCCPHPSHPKSARVHVLVCETHKKDPKNLELLEKFKEKFIKNCKVSLPDYGKNISCFIDVVCVSKPLTSENIFDFVCDVEIVDCALFNLQTVVVSCNVTIKMFFDNGCGDMVIKKAAVEVLVSMGRAKLIRPGPIDLKGVGDQTSTCFDGVYSISLPLSNGGNAILTGLSLPRVTSHFPEYQLRVAGDDLKTRCLSEKGQSFVDGLPSFPDAVGGDTDILLGIKYAKYLPRIVYQSEDGFGIAESAFSSPDGSRGVLYGPHEEFTRIEREYRGMHATQMAFFHQTLNHSRYLSMLSMSMSLIEGVKDELRMIDFDEPVCCSILDDVIEPSSDVSLECVSGSSYASKRPPKCIRQFDEIEKAGTEVTYRCVDCRGCPNYKYGERFDSVSIEAEHQQALIEKSVEVIPEEGITVASLPFVVDPDSRIDTDSVLQTASKVYRSQVRILNSNPSDKASVVASEAKLQELGFVDYVDNFDPEVRDSIFGSAVKYFIPWRAVFSEKSASTPCRLVFDASMGSKNSCSLNSMLAKGVNGMNKLMEVFLRWTTKPDAFHTDVSKMYNCVKLKKDHWRYQLYLWSDGLDPDVPPRWKGVKTAIYGVRSSGNQAECALRRVAELSRSTYPEASSSIIDDTYVDDCLSGTSSTEDTIRVTDEMQAALAPAGFTLKGVSRSGECPPEHLTTDSESVNVGGMRWYPKGDFLKFNIKELNLGKKVRGKKSPSMEGVIPDEIAMRECSRVVHEIFDIKGLLAPITGGFKVDMSVLHQRCPKWDDPIPAELRNIWIANFDVIKEIGNLQFQRAVIPSDAVSLDAETIETADAGEHLICVAIYVRYSLKGGGHSCQLIFARTKIIHDITIPRAELAAALLNASSGHVVLLSLKGMIKKRWKLTDSQVALHWLNCTKTGLKMWVRNRVVESMRLSTPELWFHVASENMIADLGTRKGATIEDVGPNSKWINGYPWMSGEEKDFPLKTVDEIILSSAEIGLDLPVSSYQSRPTGNS